jgi:hypothetical protein
MNYIYKYILITLAKALAFAMVNLFFRQVMRGI